MYAFTIDGIYMFVKTTLGDIWAMELCITIRNKDT